MSPTIFHLARTLISALSYTLMLTVQLQEKHCKTISQVKSLQPFLSSTEQLKDVPTFWLKI